MPAPSQRRQQRVIEPAGTRSRQPVAGPWPAALVLFDVQLSSVLEFLGVGWTSSASPGTSVQRLRMQIPGPPAARQERGLPTHHRVPHLRPAQFARDRTHLADQTVLDHQLEECGSLQPPVRDPKSPPGSWPGIPPLQDQACLFLAQFLPFNDLWLCHCLGIHSI